MSEINKINLNNVEYDIEDTKARFRVDNLESKYAKDLAACNEVTSSDEDLRAGAYAVKELDTKFEENLVTNNIHFIFDYKNGKYGYNTDPNRGADTFHPFKNGFKNFDLHIDYVTTVYVTNDYHGEHSEWTETRNGYIDISCRNGAITSYNCYPNNYDSGYGKSYICYIHSIYNNIRNVRLTILDD